jgi:hypothetical protein
MTKHAERMVSWHEGELTKRRNKSIKDHHAKRILYWSKK